MIMRFTHVKLLLCGLLCAVAFPTYAANYVVTPMLIDHTVEERQVLTETIKITNTGPQPIRVYPSVHEVEVGEGGEINAFVPGSMSDRKTSVTSWLEISRKRNVIGPGETVEVPLTIRINPQAKPGEYHAVVGFGNGQNLDTAEQQVLAGTAPAVIIRISLDEKRNIFLKLRGFVVDRIVKDTEAEAVSYRIENAGEEPVVPGGEIIFYNARGLEVGSTPVNPDLKEISPGDVMEFTEPVPVAEGFGKHKAFLDIAYISGEKQIAALHDTAFFYIVPIRALLIIFVSVLVLAVLVTWLLYRRYDDYDDDDDDSDEVPMFVRKGVTRDGHETDVDLKNNANAP